jgi:uncharacterized membrane protein
MDDKRLLRKARILVRAKKAYVIIATVFASVSVLLFTLSIKIGGDAGFWLRFPILIFCLILIILYVAIFGITRMSHQWSEQNDMKMLAGGIELPQLYGQKKSSKSYREEDLV